MGYFQLTAVDNKLRDIDNSSNSLGIWGKYIKHHYLVDITAHELRQMLDLDEDYSFEDCKDVEVEEVPYHVVAALAERFGFEDESRLYDYQLCHCDKGEPKGINQQSRDEKINEYLSKANRLLRQGHKTDCFALYEKLLVKYPKNFEIPYRYGDLYEYCALGDRSGFNENKAFALFERALSVAKKDDKKKVEQRLNHYYIMNNIAL
ncbi:MAG: hypothetical protein KME46_32615 [Brasilonema angustatum HA4187-MV1]|jgi:hypothetical protein|nr:hypothetical protein [Brasilonema angustatum HA4187-MV1]